MGFIHDEISYGFVSSTCTGRHWDNLRIYSCEYLGNFCFLFEKFLNVDNYCRWCHMARCTQFVLCDNVFFQLLVSGHWYCPGTPVYSTNTTYRHNIADILLKLAISIHNLNPLLY